MSALLCAVVLMVLQGCTLAVAKVPKCDPAITSRMAEFHPNGIPKNIISSLQKNGRYSYVVVSSDEATFLGMNVRCLGITIEDGAYATTYYKLARFPTAKFSFPIREDNGVLIQQTKEHETAYKLYVIYISDAGVIFTYRCCDDCSGAEPNVGIAVADKLKYSQDTIAALQTAKAKMHDLGLDKDVAEIPYCT